MGGTSFNGRVRHLKEVHHLEKNTSSKVGLEAIRRLK